jgi:23S rRNA pseudouridine1911/1915/1917 synthase
MSNLNFTFISNTQGRLDRVIFGLLDEANQKIWTRSKIQKFILKDGIFINNLEYFETKTILKIGDEIRLDWSAEPQKIDEFLATHIEIVFQSADYLVLNKPPGLVVHAGADHEKDTLEEWLSLKFPEQKAIKELKETENEHQTPHLGAGLVHRLDKDTQGLILVAQSFENLKFFQEQFKQRQVKKKYLAILTGLFEQSVSLKGFQARTRRNVLKQFFTLENVLDPEIANKIAKTIPLKGQWRTSESIFRPVLICPELNLSLVEVEILTGRMHQIRLQAEFMGFCLHQDPLYNQRMTSNFFELQSRFPQKLEISASKPKTMEAKIFQEMMKRTFKFDHRTSFYLMSNFLSFKDLSSELKNYQILDLLDF